MAWNDHLELDRVLHNLQLGRAVFEECAELVRVAGPMLEEIVVGLRVVVTEIYRDGTDSTVQLHKDF